MLLIMTPRSPRLQAAALRLAAERVERGGSLAPALAAAIAKDVASHPEELEELEGYAALDEPIAEWLRDELDWREDNDRGGESWEAVEARVRESLARRRTA
jgi:hypothetical protein